MTLIPTIYGLRLMDNVELGHETLRSMRSLSVSESRLRWKRSLPFVGVEPSLSPAVDQSLKKLSVKCFNKHNRSGSKITGVEFYSPLTFQYLLSDLIHRGGSSSALMASSFLGIPTVFLKSIEANQAWIKKRPVRKVKVVMPFTSMKQTLYDQLYAVGTPFLRLLLIPAEEYSSLLIGKCSQSALENILDNMSSNENHFVDNIEVDLKLKSCGMIDQVDISFLLEDRSLLQSHCGLVIDQENSFPVFLIGSFTDKHLPEVELFYCPFPWKNVSSKSCLSSENLQLVTDSCHESEIDYKIRLKVLAKDKPLSGKDED